ncbi:MAG: D-alanyl-lipoteichoic acid biosynthesis protein DltB [Clostridium sp.]|nr:D-alanyl-lipoteichoic acid biosynthesis protein DltB [Clostridium sp.]
MSFFGDLQFFICLIILLIPAIFLGVMEKSLKGYRLLSSLIFIFLVIGSDKKQLLFWGIFFLIEFLTVSIYLNLRKKYGRNNNIYTLFLVISIIPLVLCKLSGILPFHLFQILGISYVTFRTAQIIIEIFDGVINEINFLEFTGFLIFFPSISSGPIDRSRRFSEDWNKVYKRNEYLNLLGDGIEKILIGILYKFVLAAIFYKIEESFIESYSFLSMLFYGYSYGFYMFFDFAGYSLMAIGTSYILGIKTPENFNKPFISKDIKEFWDRWHITLSHWFRDFVFSRFVMKCIKKKWFSTKLQRASVGFIVNMLIMGVWHGITPYYILYGLYHGILLAVTETYQKKSKFYKKNKKKKWYQVLSWFITINLVMFGFLIFSGRFTEYISKLL